MSHRQFASGLAFAGLTAACLLVAACDPPGKPPAHESQAENREQIKDFQTLFQSNCSGCHGSEGINGAARPLNDALYLAVIPRQAMHDVVEYGRGGTSMPAWAKSEGGPLTEEQVNVLVDGIYSHWGKPQQFSGTQLPTYAATGGNGSNGAKLFARSCFMCHGKGAAVGMITDADYTSLVSNQYIRSMIITGRKDFGMPDYRVLGMGHPLSDSDISDLAAYVASFRPPEITAQMYSGNVRAGEQAGAAGALENENGSGNSGAQTKGNEGSGTGPGSPRPPQKEEGNKQHGSSERGIK